MDFLTSAEAELDSLMASFGRHALTLDLLAGAIAKFYGGDATKVGQIQTLDDSPDSLQAQRLSYTLNIYLEKLEKPLLDLMTRLCVFRFGVTAQALREIFLKDKTGSISGSLAKAENFTTAITISNEIITLQISSDFKLAFSSRIKMFIVRLIMILLEYRAGCTANS